MTADDKKHISLGKHLPRINIVDGAQYSLTLVAENYSKNNVHGVEDILSVQQYIL